MNKKITKTIMSLIVFVVFLGIINLDDVHATRAYCVYEYGDASFGIKINNSGGLVEYTFFDNSYYDSNASFFEGFINDVEGYANEFMKNSGNLKIRNWYSPYLGVSGSGVYDNLNKKCPKNVFYVEAFSTHSIIFSDGSDEYEIAVQKQLEIEDEDASGVGQTVNNGVISSMNFVGSAYTWVKNLITGSDDEYDDIPYHIMLVYDLEDEYYVEDQEDPEDEEVIDDKSEREWNDPTVKPVNPMDEEKVNYSCGNGMITGLPSRIPKFGKFLYNFLQFLVPIALVLLGTIDLIKAIVGSKEDDIKKNQSIFIKRLISAAIVFFSFALVKLILSIVAEDSANIIQCVDCILRDSSNCIEEN